MAVSKFKATCLSVLERVRNTGRPILVTKFGVPLAEVTPPPATERPRLWVGAMQGTGEILGDIVSPIGRERDWKAARR
jgi:prevent-host-death family protein